ncbi:MAG: HAMP domain-containing histidine kinase [Nanoarchaeota archaeon]|nr:HAMP domain-containing histidine kinase [Nanoarchaeota archaeon]
MNGIFSIFKKEKPEVKETEIRVADGIIDYAVSLIKDKESIKEQLKEIDKIRKLPVDEREYSYLLVYLSLERVILAKKPAPTKEYFSRKILKKPKEFTQDGLRRTIRKKFEINKLGVYFRVLFLNEPQQSLILYELMFQEFMDLISDKIKKKIPDVILKENYDVLNGTKIENGKMDLSSVNEKIEEKQVNVEDIIIPFKNLFFVFYSNVVKSDGKELADKLVMDVYNFVEIYGHPLTSAAIQILPKITSKETKAAAAHRIVDYLSMLILRKDLIKPQIDKIADAETLPEEGKEKVYFSIYLELEKFMIDHLPPAVEKSFTREELRKEIREKINTQNLEHRFKLLFLGEKEQLIELFNMFYGLLLEQMVSFWAAGDLQKFVSENVKGTMLDSLGFTIEKKEIGFDVSETNIDTLPKNKLKDVIHDLSAFLLVLYKNAKETGGEKKAEKAISKAYKIMKEQYGMLPIFNDFVRAIPEGVLDYENKILLSPRAAEEVVTYITKILKKEKIEEHLKAMEETRKLPLEEQAEAFFNIYINLQHYIIEERPSFKGKEITLSDLKEKIRRHVNVKDLEDKFQLLFLTHDEVLVKLVRDLIKECIVNFIDKKALVEAVKDLTKKNSFLRNVEIDEEGLIDFEPFFDKLKKVEVAKVRVLSITLSKIVLAIYEKSKEILGELQAKKLFEIAYANLQKKYGANLLQVLRVIPKGILEAEKFELLGKEEIEKTAKEMVKIDTIKGEFMNIAAHELKTPLVPIISYLEMLLNDKRLARDQKEKLRICLSSAKREADLVSDILDISKLEAGSLKLEFETLDMVELLKEITDGLGPAIRGKKLAFKVEVPSKLPLVRGDKRRLTQVVSNLINNATKFTDKGSITVRAQMEKQNILVSVIDTGMGISKENIHKLFTKFFQVDSTARRKQGGTGLGLAISKGIIQGHKGKLWVESDGIGKGTTFSFTVPYLPTTEKEKMETQREQNSFVSQEPKVKTEKVIKNKAKEKKKEKDKVRKSRHKKSSIIKNTRKS